MAEKVKTAETEKEKTLVKKPATKTSSDEKVAKAPAKQVKEEKVETAKKPVLATEKPSVKTDSVKAQPKAQKVEKTEKTEKTPNSQTPKIAEKTTVVAKKAKTSKKGDPGVFIATGRRKKSVARVRLIAGGSGKITVNKRDIDDYLLLDTLKLVVRQPLKLTDTEKSYDVVVNVFGGGYTGQTGAIRHGIARALVKENETFKAELKKAGFLSRDSRMKERKKYGLKKARKAPQFSKR